MGDEFTDIPDIPFNDWEEPEEFPKQPVQYEPIPDDAPFDSVEESPPAAEPPVETLPTEPETVPDVSPAPPDGEAAEGVGDVPESEPLVQIDYTDILAETNEKMDRLILEIQKTEQLAGSLQNAMPALLCMSGIIIGVLLLHILASYLRP